MFGEEFMVKFVEVLLNIYIRSYQTEKASISDCHINDRRHFCQTFWASSPADIKKLGLTFREPPPFLRHQLFDISSMAVFEQKLSSKVKLDDYVPLTCTIEATQSAKDHTEYIIRVQRGPVAENNWTIEKRYSDFVSLDTTLKISGIEMPLPPKKVFGNMGREFIAERQLGLQNYLNCLLRMPYLAHSLIVKRFLDPHNYTLNLQETALQHISMFFRSEPKWEVIEPLPDIGCRLRKRYFSIKDKGIPKAQFILSWCNFGPDKFLSDKDLVNVMKLFPSFQHPYIYPVSFSMSNETSGIAIRPFYPNGTIRDIICKTKPRGVYLKKYGSPKQTCGCQLTDLRLYGRQILETLKFLHDKGLPYGHLHSGNVLIEAQKCRLLDIENGILGLPSIYRPYFTQFRKIQTSEMIDVYSFGHLLYELVFGVPLNAATCDNFPPQCPPELRSVLESILTTEACKNGLPTVSDLLLHPLFDSVVLPPTDKPVVKIPSKLKECLREAKASMDKRLKEEQKVINQVKRLSKAQAFHNSDEEKKKRRKSKKKLLEATAEVGEGDATTPASSNGTETPTSPTTQNEPVSSTPPPPAGVPSPVHAAVPPAPPPPSHPPGGSTQSGDEPKARGALLGSICNFNKGGLRKAETVDKSGPKF